MELNLTYKLEIHAYFFLSFVVDLFDDLDAYEAHMKANISAHENGGFHCGLCGKIMRYLNNTRRHIRETHMKNSKRFICPLCDKSFTVKRHLGSHLSTCHLDMDQGKLKNDLDF